MSEEIDKSKNIEKWEHNGKTYLGIEDVEDYAIRCPKCVFNRLKSIGSVSFNDCLADEEGGDGDYACSDRDDGKFMYFIKK